MAREDEEVMEVVKGRDCRLFYQLVDNNSGQTNVTVNELAVKEDEEEALFLFLDSTLKMPGAYQTGG